MGLVDMMEAPKEFKGIFVWDPRLGRMFADSNYINEQLLLYRLPLIVFTDDFGDRKYGSALFESEESWNKEANSSQCKIAGMTAHDSFEFINRRAMFLDNNTRETETAYTWMKTEYRDKEDYKEVYLLDDAYIDKSTGIIKCKIPGKSDIDLCGVPFCEYDPALHMLDDGDYDYKDIKTWPLVILYPIGISEEEE